MESPSLAILCLWVGGPGAGACGLPAAPSIPSGCFVCLYLTHSVSCLGRLGRNAKLSKRGCSGQQNRGALFSRTPQTCLVGARVSSRKDK